MTFEKDIADQAFMKREYGFLIEYCQKAIGEDPLDYQPHVSISDAFSMLKMYQNAIDHEKIALTLLKDNQLKERYGILYGLGTDYMNTGLLDEAKLAFIEIEKEPYFQIDSYFIQLAIAIKQAKILEAERLFKLLPDDFVRHYIIGRPYTDKAILRQEIDKLKD
ncbi:tetratricopeptide repeat protein [Bartonella sp. HY761]|uniref:tetratricopeptide repeat protein n=1 Tax=Bartonella sp. HY761 TaxID=2979330 RepID=UPI00220104D5|nr:hypothetical protein [Bartonella sp. HY761]UXN06811.1 hypothetical protein N6A79_02025 [Bartonella sp. HY761]